jgi:hypothetical protein
MSGLNQRRIVGALMSVTAFTACSSQLQRTAPDPSAWSPLSCSTCPKARVAIETRRSIRDDGRVGTHLFLRLRNLNDYDVVLVADFRTDAAPEDGYVPGEELRVSLGRAGTPEAEVVLMLSRTDIASAGLSRVERIAAQATATRRP